jgi:hypothetical protein
VAKFRGIEGVSSRAGDALGYGLPPGHYELPDEEIVRTADEVGVRLAAAEGAVFMLGAFPAGEALTAEDEIAASLEAAEGIDSTHEQVPGSVVVPSEVKATE